MIAAMCALIQEPIVVAKTKEMVVKFTDSLAKTKRYNDIHIPSHYVYPQPRLFVTVTFM